MFASVQRGMPRILLLAYLGVVNLLFAHLPELASLRGGVMQILAPLCMGAGLVFMGLAAGDLATRILQPRIDAQDMAMHARRNGCTASALVYLGRMILVAAVLLLMVTAARASAPPAAAVPFLPMLLKEQRAYWPDMPVPSALGAQVEQETCPSLKSAQCWNPHAQLRTSREQGLGLGQITRTWRADGSQRFDALAELKASFPHELAGWSWDAPYDPAMQLRALVLKDLQGYRLVLGTRSGGDHLAMSLAAYNGGSGGLANDRRMCAATNGCDPGVWFGNVEKTSLKARTALPGYGQSAFDTNRGYVRNVMVVRRERYVSMEAMCWAS